MKTVPLPMYIPEGPINPLHTIPFHFDPSKVGLDTYFNGTCARPPSEAYQMHNAGLSIFRNSPPQKRKSGGEIFAAIEAQGKKALRTNDRFLDSLGHHILIIHSALAPDPGKKIPRFVSQMAEGLVKNHGIKVTILECGSPEMGAEFSPDEIIRRIKTGGGNTLEEIARRALAFLDSEGSIEKIALIASHGHDGGRFGQFIAKSRLDAAADRLMRAAFGKILDPSEGTKLLNPYLLGKSAVQRWRTTKESTWVTSCEGIITWIYEMMGLKITKSELKVFARTMETSAKKTGNGLDDNDFMQAVGNFLFRMAEKDLRRRLLAENPHIWIPHYPQEETKNIFTARAGNIEETLLLPPRSQAAFPSARQAVAMDEDMLDYLYSNGAGQEGTTEVLGVQTLDELIFELIGFTAGLPAVSQGQELDDAFETDEGVKAMPAEADDS